MNSRRRINALNDQYEAVHLFNLDAGKAPKADTAWLALKRRGAGRKDTITSKSDKDATECH